MSTHRSAFTLIEVLIVVIVMAILAATVLPRFASSGKDAKDAALRQDLHVMRSQIELYRQEHGSYPAGDAASFADQLTTKTNMDGKSDPAGEYGPYLQDRIPTNPFNNSNKVAMVKGDKPPAVATGGPEGWQYNAAHGWFYPNNAEYFKAGSALAVAEATATTTATAL